MPSLKLPSVPNKKQVYFSEICALLHSCILGLGGRGRGGRDGTGGHRTHKLTFHDKTVAEQMCDMSHLVCHWLSFVTLTGSGSVWGLPGGSEDVRERGRSPERLLLAAAPQPIQTRPHALPPTVQSQRERSRRQLCQRFT